MVKASVEDALQNQGNTQPERDEALIRERLEAYRAIIAGNLSEGFTQMPDQVREDPMLSRAAKLVYEQLLHYTRQKSFCWPSQQRIADDLVTISRRTVIRAINELYERCYIEKWRRGLNRTNIYYINPLSFINPQSFPDSFKRPWRGQGMFLETPSPAHAGVDTVSQADILSSSSRKCQIDTSSNANLALQDAPNWHIKHTESNKTKTETNSAESKIRRGSAAPEKRRVLPIPIPVCSHIACRTIGKTENVQDIKLHKSSNLEQQGDDAKQNEISNQSKIKETGRLERVKSVEVDKTSKKTRTFEEMAALVGIAPADLEDMLTWLRENGRPEFTPLKLQGVIPQWSRELGNAEPQLIAANITQSGKLYKYARIRGLSQQAVEGCFEHAREAVRNHPEVVKKMAFFFASLKLDILVALKQDRDLPATGSLVSSSIPDGYDENLPADDVPADVSPIETEVVAVVTRRTGVPEPEVQLEPKVKMISTDDPQTGWPTFEGADNRGEHLLNELDPYRATFTWVTRQTPYGRWGFEVVRRKGRVVEMECLNNVDILACKALLGQR